MALFEMFELYIIIQHQIWVVFNLHHSWSFAFSRSHSRNPSAQGRPAVQGHRHPERRKVKRFSWALNLVSLKTLLLFSFFLDDLVYLDGTMWLKNEHKWWENIHARFWSLTQILILFIIFWQKKSPQMDQEMQN